MTARRPVVLVDGKPKQLPDGDTVDTGQATVAKQTIPLSEGQTSVTVPGGYTTAGVMVFLNGTYLSPSEYTATDLTTVVLSTGAPSADSMLDVLVFTSEGLTAFTSAGYALLTAADYATQRTLLSLGSAALLNAIGSGSLYGRDSILGSVSQSAGVPTGAIIESGSNSNGRYTKFADGTMICTGTFTSVVAVTAPYGAGFYGACNWTYPAAFIDSPAISFSARASGRVWMTAESYVSLVDTAFFVFEIYLAITASAVQRWSAIGRWY